MSNVLIGLRDWVDARLPIMKAWNTHMARYYAPKNFNFWYFFRCAVVAGAGQSVAHRDLADDELYAFSRGCVCVR